MDLYLRANGRILKKSQMLPKHNFTVFGRFSKQYRWVFRVYGLEETHIRMLTSP
jgi:hypothetical protein